MLLSNYAWYELLGPLTLAAAVMLSFWYVRTIIKSPHYHTTKTQTSYFFTAVALFYLAQGSPFDIIAEDYLVSALILQLSIMAFIVVPFFILSLPKAYLNIFFWRHKRARVAAFMFKHPWPLAIIFNGLITVYLIPSVFNVVSGNVLLQFIYEVAIVLFAFLTWWVIIQPSDEVAEHSYFMRVAYVFFTTLFLMPIGIFLLVLQDPVYTTYTGVAGELIPALTAVYDQQAAGGLLKFVQITCYSIALFHLLKKWGLQEEENEGKVDEDTRVVQGVVIKLNDRNRRKSRKKR
ncbi:cytochrome c oxidase assembly protein [Lentibacillus persicus]|nr:cytochrome c oxidase assembly protein [Lentibacillus persicus]